MPKPELTFFTELNSEKLTALFNDPAVIKNLQRLNASVSLGILDLSDARAKVVRKLNQAGIPMIAWLLLPENEGYWFHIDNHEKAVARYGAFKEWTQQHKLHWMGIGLDIEMDINDMRQVLKQKKSKKFFSTVFNRLRDKQRVVAAHHAYKALVNWIHADGYLVESYHLPFITEERRARSTVLQRAVGLVDLQTDREILMLYTSFLRPNGDAILWSYAPQTDSVGVGNTGGGVDVEGLIDKAPLSWDELSRDLRLCVMSKKPIHIFCLEGCIEQGFLDRLVDFDWDKPVPVPGARGKVKALRTGLTAGLWLFERPWVILLSLATLIGLGFLFKRNQEP